MSTVRYGTNFLKFLSIVLLAATRAIIGRHGSGRGVNLSGDDERGRGRGRGSGGRGRGRPIAVEVSTIEVEGPAPPRAIRGRKPATITDPIIAPEVVVRGGRGRGRQIVEVAQAVEVEAPVAVVQLRRGRSSRQT